MKNIVTTAALLTLALPFAACSESGTSAADKGTGPSATMEQMGDKAHEMAGAAATKFAELKAEVEKATQGKLAGFEGQITQLKQQAASLSGEAKAEYQTLLDQIAAKRTEVSQQLAGLKTQGEEGFKAVQDKLGAATAELQKLIEQALAKAK